MHGDEKTEFSRMNEMLAIYKRNIAKNHTASYMGTNNYTKKVSQQFLVALRLMVKQKNHAVVLCEIVKVFYKCI